MLDKSRTSTISSIVPLTINEYGVELSSVRRTSDNQSITSNRDSSDEKSNTVRSRFQKIVKKI